MTVTCQSIQLQPLKRVPTLVDLENLLSWLSHCQETYLLENMDSLKQVILPWFGDATQQFALGVTISKKLPEKLPIWTFYKRLEPEPEVEWAYPSPDVSLIHNMLLCAFPNEEHTPAAHKSYAYVPPLHHFQEESKQEDSQRLKRDQQEKTLKLDRPVVLHGSLQKLQMEGLLQSLASSRLTGSVVVTLHDLAGAIYFEHGIPVHCELNGVEGHDAMLDLLAWRVGDFEVLCDERTSKRSISRRIESLLMESATLQDFEHYLEKQQINGQTILEKVPMSNTEFFERMKNAPPLDEKLLKLIAHLLDGRRSLDDIVKKSCVSKTHWLPVIYALVKAAVARVRALEPASTANRALIQAQAAQVSAQGLVQPRTGLYTHASFLFFLNLEQTRHLFYLRPFSVILLALRKDNGLMIDEHALMQSVDRIKKVTRPCDLLCHVDNANLGIILPETSKAAAQKVARKISEVLAPEHVARVGQTDSVWARVGCASVPDDTISIDELLSICLDHEHSSVSFAQ